MVPCAGKEWGECLTQFANRSKAQGNLETCTPSHPHAGVHLVSKKDLPKLKLVC